VNLRRDGSVDLREERGASVGELLVATATGLVLAALCGQAFAVSNATYRSAVTKLDRDQQAQSALAVIAAEVGAIVDAPRSTGCPSRGIQIAPGRMEFSANLYDRDTQLRDAALSGSRDVAVATRDVFEAGDMVRLTDPGAFDDPSDDASQCVRIANISTDRLTLETALARSFPAQSAVALVNRVTYRLDGQARLMRTQDGGTQRIADHVVGFDVEQTDRLLTIRLTMEDVPTRQRRLVVDRP
jgi:hypothetical protein